MKRAVRVQDDRVLEAVTSAQSARVPKQSHEGREALGPKDRVAELRVSAHLMTLDRGLYCVFPKSGGPVSDPTTGLPGVRITPAPGIFARREAVIVSTFREDGWLDGTAALVQVADGSAQILVSVYQNAHPGQDDAPGLQVLRLSGNQKSVISEPEPATNKTVASAAKSNPDVVAHVQRAGDVGGKIGDWIGVKGSGQWVEGFGLVSNGEFSACDIEYQGVLGQNWMSPWVEGENFCGSRGMALPLLGLKVRLKGGMAKIFECSYSATFIDGSATGPINAGEICRAASLAPLEAFQIAIYPRSTAATRRAGPKTHHQKLVRSSKISDSVKKSAALTVRRSAKR